MKLLYNIFTFFGLASSVFSLECYTCVRQDGNTDKCIKTVKQCEESQNICRTNISWGIPPYWTPHGDRIYKISKDCDVKKRCEDDRYRLRNRCKRDWYNDWDCVECCSGDMCNFFVTLGADGVRLSFVAFIVALVTHFVLQHR